MADDHPSYEAEVGARLRSLREARGWSQQEVANRMKRRGFDWLQTTVAKTEAAARPIRVNEVFALAQVFEESLDALIFERSIRGNLVHAVHVAADALSEAQSDLVDAQTRVAAATEAHAQAVRRIEEFDRSRER